MFEYDDAVVRLTHPNAAAMMADVRKRMTQGEGFALATVKFDDLVEFGRDADARRAYVAHDIVVAEGRQVAWLARLAGQAIEAVPGADLMLPLARLSAVSKRRSPWWAVRPRRCRPWPTTFGPSCRSLTSGCRSRRR